MVETREMEPLLLVEDKTELRAMLRKALERAGYTVDEAPDGAAAIQKIRARRYLLVITDLKMPGASGLDVLRETKQADAAIPVLLLTAYGSVEEAVAAMKEGAFDFLQKPVDLEHLKLLVQRAARQQELLRENLLLREEYSTRYGFPRIVGEHPSIREVSQQIQKVAATDSTCLLLGESGTGKELFALAISSGTNEERSPGRVHARSGRWTWRIAERFFWMKLGSCRWLSRQNCCACWKRKDSKGWAGHNRSMWTFESWWPRIAICRNWRKKNYSAKICIFEFRRFR